MADPSIQDPEWENARNWFNGMNASNRNQMILALYRVSLENKGTEKLIENVHVQWQQKYTQLLTTNTQLGRENELLTQNQESFVGTIVGRIKDLE